MRLFVGFALLVSYTVAQSCGARGTIKGSPPNWGTFPSADDAYDCGRNCAGTTQCQSYVVGGPEGCQLIGASVSSSYNANDSSPYQFYQKGACDYTIYRVTPPLSIPTPTPTGSVCGVKGYDKANPGSFYAYTDAAYTTFGGCYLQCNDRGSGCLAFAIGDGNCLLYSVNLLNDVDADPGSGFTYYDMNCVVVGSGTASSNAAQATSPPSSTSKSTSSTSTSTSSSKTTTTSKSSTTSKGASSSAAGVQAVSSSSSSGSNVCGVKGYDKQSPGAFDSDGTSTTVTSCTKLCKSTSTCKGFAVGGGLCLLYSSRVDTNIDTDPSSPYAFYDLDCFGGSSTSASLPSSTFGTSTRTISAASTASANLCHWKGYEVDGADSSIIGFQYKPSAGCKSFCTGKTALSYEQYYDYCICFSKAVQSVGSSNTSSLVIFNDIAC